MTAEPDHAPPPAPALARRVVATLLGLLLLTAAGWAIARSGDWASLRSSISQAPANILATLLLAPVLHVALSAAVFAVLTRRFGRVTPPEFLALVSAAWLFNFLPLRPGLGGRLVYHRTVNHIPFRHSVRVVIEAVSTGAIGVALPIAALLALRAGVPLPVGASVLAVTPFALAGALHRSATASAYALAIGIKHADAWVWALQYFAAFHAVGHPVTFEQAAAIAAVSQAATLIPLSGNGLGLREWSVGWLASTLPAWFAVGPQRDLAQGLAADVLNRAAEVLVAIPLGLASYAYLVRRLARARTAEAAA